MKKAIILGIFAIAAISFWSCSKEAPSKDSAQIAKEALEQVKEAPTLESASIEDLMATWANKSIQLDTEKPTFKQFVASICAQHPEFIGNYETLRYLSDEAGYKGTDKYEVNDNKESNFIKFAPKVNDKELTDPADTIKCVVSYQTWEFDNGKQLVGVLYQRNEDYLVNFYEFLPLKKELKPNTVFADNVQHNINKAVQYGYKDVIFTGGLNIEFVKQKDGKETYYYDHWNGKNFEHVVHESTR